MGVGGLPEPQAQRSSSGGRGGGVERVCFSFENCDGVFGKVWLGASVMLTCTSHTTDRQTTHTPQTNTQLTCTCASHNTDNLDKLVAWDWGGDDGGGDDDDGDDDDDADDADSSDDTSTPSPSTPTLGSYSNLNPPTPTLTAGARCCWLTLLYHCT